MKREKELPMFVTPARADQAGGASSPSEPPDSGRRVGRHVLQFRGLSPRAGAWAARWITCLLAIVATFAAAGQEPAADQAATPEALAVGEETLLLADGPGDGVQATPAIASGGNGYLAVWREGWNGKGGNARIFAARIDRAGKVLDSRGIELAPSRAGFQEAPRVAFSPAAGGVYLVVWQDFRNGKDLDILAARVSADSDKSGRAAVLDAELIRVAAGPRTQALPDVASDGSGFLVAWQGLEGDAALYSGYAATVSAEGKIGAAVKTGALPQVRLAWGGQKYLAVYGVAEIFAKVLGPDGQSAAGDKGISIGMRCKAALFSVSGAGEKGWLVVGHRSPPDPWGWGGPGAMRCAIVTPNGKLDNPTAKEPDGNWDKLSNWLDVGGRNRTTWPLGESACAWDGRQSVAVWPRHHICGEKKSSFTNCDLLVSRVEGWKPLDADGVPVAVSGADERSPALASCGTGSLLCVYEKCESGKTLVAARTISTR